VQGPDFINTSLKTGASPYHPKVIWACFVFGCILVASVWLRYNHIRIEDKIIIIWIISVFNVVASMIREMYYGLADLIRSILFLVVYAVIISEKIHRTVITLLGSAVDGFLCITASIPLFIAFLNSSVKLGKICRKS
jgi:hypothetical protein